MPAGREAGLINRDFAPQAYYFSVALWSTQFNQLYRQVLAGLAAIHFEALLAALAGLTLLGAACGWLFRRGRQPERVAAASCTLAQGWVLIGVQVLLLFGFQAICGYVYQQLALPEPPRLWRG